MSQRKGTKKELKEGGWQKVRTSPQANENWVAKSTHPCVKKTHKMKRRYCEKQKSQMFQKLTKHHKKRAKLGDVTETRSLIN